MQCLRCRAALYESSSTAAALPPRRALLLALSSLPWAAPARTAEPWSVSGTVRLADEKELRVGEQAALYLTLRPSNGGGPVAAKRLPLNGRALFPLPFTFAEEDALTDAPPYEAWSSLSLVVSGRMDSDGVAATRDAEDLVGRGLAAKLAGAAGWQNAVVILQGRGLAGRLLTKRQ